MQKKNCTSSKIILPRKSAIAIHHSLQFLYIYIYTSAFNWLNQKSFYKIEQLNFPNNICANNK